jgi:signal transduction histidine kinase
MFPLLTEVVRERADRLSAAGLTLDLRGDRSAGCVTGDARRLRRAFGQLVDNAIAATAEGGRILVEASRRKGGPLQVVVSDNGRGMEPEVLARALEGLKLDAEGKAVERRQGLGLPLVRQLVEAHGGTLELMSEPGLGTSAIVVLP